MRYKFNIKTDDWEICKHPFATHVKPGATRLIIGTFPTYQDNYKNTFEFYYAGERNRFWEVINEVFKPDFKYYNGSEAKKEREEFFFKNGIGITDMHEKCWRRNKSSLDKDLYPIILTDVFKILREFNTIKTIILTSRTGPMSALGLLRTYFIQQDRNLEDSVEDIFRIKRTEFEFEGRVIKVLVPHSTSSTNDKVTMSQLIAMYKKCLRDE